jgi:hypothetical protein
MAILRLGWRRKRLADTPMPAAPPQTRRISNELARVERLAEATWFPCILLWIIDGIGWCSIARSTAFSRRHPGVSASPMTFDVHPPWPGFDLATGHPVPSLPPADPATGCPDIGAVAPARMPIGPGVAASVRRRRAAFVTRRRRWAVRTSLSPPRWRWRAARTTECRHPAAPATPVNSSAIHSKVATILAENASEISRYDMLFLSQIDDFSRVLLINRC